MPCPQLTGKFYAVTKRMKQKFFAVLDCLKQQDLVYALKIPKNTYV